MQLRPTYCRFGAIICPFCSGTSLTAATAHNFQRTSSARTLWFWRTLAKLVRANRKVRSRNSTACDTFLQQSLQSTAGLNASRFSAKKKARSPAVARIADRIGCQW